MTVESSKPDLVIHPEIAAALAAKRIAVVFPGQGSQSVGMLLELSEQYPIVNKTFDEASETLGFDLWAICQDELKLGLTEYTQPALLAASMAIWRILQQKISTPIVCLAGHSLGEYSALCAAGSITFRDAITLVHQRGQFMQQAVVGIETKMAAVLGLENHQIISICNQVVEIDEDAIVSAANFNSPNQVVIAGNTTGIDVVKQQVQMMGKKIIPLKVSVPSHCALMEPAGLQLKKTLDSIKFSLPNIPVIQNLDARSHELTTEIKHALTNQLCEPVLWAQTMQLFADKHINTIIECGPGTVLSNLSKRQAKPIASFPTDKPVRLDKLFEVLK